ncbi:hypothetical protein B7O92_07480 [Streptococcus agalactiae]|nr:hypothetical protein B7O92_07480 [Streptococcus agalactiae]OVF12479.1 hypothetical protein B7O94_07475 [Streptococcus agalactiae]OVF16721.1 hypothetical protein B7O93_07475 [Streptococcus agalactiae]OZG38383.1 hypothetical protein B9481_07430 [Streptococcus agalactiae]
MNCNHKKLRAKQIAKKHFFIIILPPLFVYHFNIKIQLIAFNKIMILKSTLFFGKIGGSNLSEAVE